MSLQSSVTAVHGFVPPPVSARMPWTASLPPETGAGAGLAQKGTVLHFLSDNELYAEGEEARSFYKVVSGVVRTCKFLSDGRRQIEAFHVAGDVFGLEAGVEHRLSAEAVSDCTVISYRRCGPGSLTAADDGMARQLFAYAMQCVVRAQDHSLLLGRPSAAQRVAAFLLEMADRSPGGEIIELAMTRQDIADYLGLTIETVSRTLSQFERDAIIGRPAARRIVLRNLATLRDLSM